MKKNEWVAGLAAAAILTMISPLFAESDAGKAGEASAPSELPQDPKHGTMSPSTSAVRNPNDPDTKNAETRSTGKEVETGRGHATGAAGSTDLSSGEKKSPEEAAKDHDHSAHDESLSGRQH